MHFFLVEGLHPNLTRKKRLIANCLDFVFHMTPGGLLLFFKSETQFKEGKIEREYALFFLF